MKPILKTKNLKVGIGNQIFLENLNLELFESELLWIIGRNGSGKTTLLRTLLNLANQQQSNAIFLENVAIEKLTASEIAKKISYVPQKYVGSFEITVSDFLENSRFVHETNSFGKSRETSLFVKNYLEFYGLTEFKNRKFSQVSGGERQKIMVLGALIQETPLVLLDEPLNSLDPNHQFELCELFKKLALENQKTLGIVIHDLTIPFKIGGSVLVFEGNGKYAFGKVKEVLTENYLTKIYGVNFQLLKAQNFQVPFFS
ncbi:ABC transporter ATP-binding protein [bacterium]|nr:ABC transporter ATP-binding protein [bacterium]